MNVINVEAIEAELRKIAASAVYEPVKKWVLTVPRRHILSAEMKEFDVAANFTVYDPKALKFGMPKLKELPEWARTKVKAGEVMHWFNAIQCGRRDFFKTCQDIVSWFNNFKPDDTRLNRVDRICFETAAGSAGMWTKDVCANIWHYVKDTPKVIKSYPTGYKWVQMVTQLQFEREGRLMSHCYASDVQVKVPEGFKPISELVGKEVEVFTASLGSKDSFRGKWVKTTFTSFGKQEIWNVVVRRGENYLTFKATSGHNWVVENDKFRRDYKPTRELTVGDKLTCIDTYRYGGIDHITPYQVVAVQNTYQSEEVFCCEVPDSHTFTIEGNILTGNCVGGGGYYDKYQRNQAAYYSLRDSHNNPHVTVEVQGKQLVQAKGKSNGKPDHKYQVMMRPFFTEMGWTFRDDSYID